VLFFSLFCLVLYLPHRSLCCPFLPPFTRRSSLFRFWTFTLTLTLLLPLCYSDTEPRTRTYTHKRPRPRTRPRTPPRRRYRYNIHDRRFAIRNSQYMIHDSSPPFSPIFLPFPVLPFLNFLGSHPYTHTYTRTRTRACARETRTFALFISDSDSDFDFDFDLYLQTPYPVTHSTVSRIPYLVSRIPYFVPIYHSRNKPRVLDDFNPAFPLPFLTLSLSAFDRLAVWLFGRLTRLSLIFFSTSTSAVDR
jgi:hypothetical protein